MALQNIALATSASSVRGASTDTLDTTYIQSAISLARDRIFKVPGAGSIRGVWVYNGITYAFRNNVELSQCLMYKSTSTGWTRVGFGETIDFTLGTTELFEGDTLLGVTSAASSTINRIVIQSGSWSTNDAQGYLVISSRSGSYAGGETANGLTITASATEITLPIGGNYQFLNHNFYGASNLRRMYGCNGVGYAFEFDGTIFTPIKTGMVNDTPNYIAVYKQHLFLSFPGGSVQHSGIGAPLTWSIVLGAGEIGVGDDVTGFMPGYSTALIILTINTVQTLSGDSAANWVLSTLNESSGAKDGTAQVVTTGLYVDDEGLRDIKATQEYGDFGIGTISTLVRPILLQKKNNQGVSITTSLRVKSKNQYRLYWDDGTFAIFDFSKSMPEIMFCEYSSVVRTACSSEDILGNEVLFFGGDDGYIYEMDAGTSFDGASFVSYFRLPYNHLGTPTYFKRFHKATLEIDAAPSATIYVLSDFSYGNPNQPIATEEAFSVRGGGGIFNIDNWDQFYWSSQVEGLAEARIEGIGTNISLTIYSESATEEPHTISGLILHYSQRRMQK